MNATLEYKTENEVKKLTTRFPRFLFSIVFILLVLLVGGPFLDDTMQTNIFSRPLKFEQFEFSNWMVGAMILGYISSISLGIAFLYELNVHPYYSSRLVNKDECELLAEYLDLYPEVDAYLKKVNRERAVVLYDYGVVLDWVEQQEITVLLQEEKTREAELQRKQDLACKRVQGIL